jgi:hypothetical protein
VFVIMSMRVVVTVVVPTLGFLSVFVFVRHLRVPLEFVLELSELCVSVVNYRIFHRGGTGREKESKFAGLSVPVGRVIFFSRTRPRVLGGCADVGSPWG